MNKPKILLIGAMADSVKNGDIEALKWRSRFNQEFKDRTTIMDMMVDETWETSSPLENFIANKYLLKNADIIFCCSDYIERSPGTLYELSYAEQNNIPVISFSSEQTISRITNNFYFWLLGSCHSTYEKATEYLENKYLIYFE